MVDPFVICRVKTDCSLHSQTEVGTVVGRPREMTRPSEVAGFVKNVILLVLYVYV
jgi:hypothetical protein